MGNIVYCMDWGGGIPEDSDEPRDGQCQWFVYPAKRVWEDPEIAELTGETSYFAADLDQDPVAGPFASKAEAEAALSKIKRGDR